MKVQKSRAQREGCHPSVAKEKDNSKKNIGPSGLQTTLWTKPPFLMGALIVSMVTSIAMLDCQHASVTMENHPL